VFFYTKKVIEIIKRRIMEKNKNGLVAFALLGLAVGTAAYYLLGTEDGKRQLDRANEGVKSLTQSIKELSKKEAKRAAKLAKSAKADLENFKDKAKVAGKNALDSASEKAQQWASKASDAAHSASDKADEVIAEAKAEINKA